MIVKLKHIEIKGWLGSILILLVMLPVIFYSAYEFTTLSQMISHHRTLETLGEGGTGVNRGIAIIGKNSLSNIASRLLAAVYLRSDRQS